MLKRLGLVITTIVLAGCAGSSSPVATSGRLGITQGTSEDGIEYVTNGDEFADAQITSQRLAPATDQSAGPKTDGPVGLAKRVRQFEFSRWDKGQTAKNKATRFGSDHWELKVFFKEARTIEFAGTFAAGQDGALTLKVERGPRRYSLSETSLRDLHTPYEKTFLRAKLTDSHGPDSLTISYKGYVGNIDVREDSENKAAPGSTLECQIKTLRDNTFLWVNNWVTLPKGPVFYLNDTIRKGTAKTAAENCLPARISFGGESLATASERKLPDGEVEDELYEHPVEVTAANDDGATAATTASPIEDVTLIGNPAQGNKRMFDLALRDKQSAKTTHAIVAIRPQDPADAEAPPVDDAAEGTAADAPTDAPADAPPATRTTPARRTRPSATPAAPVRDSGDAFIGGVGGTQAAREVRDFERNRNLRGVQAAIRAKRGSAEIQRFFTNAAPFVAMIRAISHAYDSVGWIYVTAIESEYLKGKVPYKTPIRGDPDGGVWLAWGPFQLHEGAAKDGGIRSFERDFFAPSACASASYVAQQVRQFPNDATMALLGYNKGAAGAGTAIYCSYHSSDRAKQRACNQRIDASQRKGGFSPREKSQFMRLALNFNYTYAEMAGYAVLTPKMTGYVDNTLATYFIANSLSSNGFTLANARRALPNNGSVMPSSGRVSSATCQAAINGTY